MTLTQIRQQLCIRHNTVASIWKEEFGQQAFDDRKRVWYRNSKLGDNNPMKGKYRKLHPKWINSERISNRKGYYRIKAPDWYEGPMDDNRYADEHVVTYCASRNLSKVPEGFVIHHLDMVKTNNDPANLVMLTNSDHLLLHAWINRTIVQRLSRMGVEE